MQVLAVKDWFGAKTEPRPGLSDMRTCLSKTASDHLAIWQAGRRAVIVRRRGAGAETEPAFRELI